MTRAEYLSIDALNFSSARHLLRSPAHYKAALEEPEDELKYIVGKLAHAMILEGKDLRHLYAIKPAGLSMATQVGKKWKSEQTLPILKEEDANRVPRMAEAIANHPIASGALKRCPRREVYFEIVYRGVRIKSMLDAMGGVPGRTRLIQICDIKTTTDAREHSFAKRVVDLDYDMQACWYKSMFGDPGQSDFVWIAVENFAPFAVNVFYPGGEMERSGQIKMDAAVDTYKECQRVNKWAACDSPVYSHEIRELYPPRWRTAELEGAGLI